MSIKSSLFPNMRLRDGSIWGYQIMVTIVLVAIWQASSAHYQTLWLPPPAAIVTKLAAWTADGTLAYHGGTTAIECGIGLAVGGFAGVVFGLLLGYFRWPRRVLYPVALLLYTVPLAALAPPLTSVLGLGIASKVAMASMTAYFLIFFSVLNGIDSIERRMIDNFRLMGASASELLIKLFLPASRLWVLTGLRTAGPFTITTAITAEIWGSRSGLGYLVKHSVEVADIAGMFAVLAILGILGVIVNIVIEFVGGEKGEV